MKEHTFKKFVDENKAFQEELIANSCQLEQRVCKVLNDYEVWEAFPTLHMILMAKAIQLKMTKEEYLKFVQDAINGTWEGIVERCNEIFPKNDSE